MASLTVISLALVLAALLGYITDRFRLSPLLGFFIAGLVTRFVLSEYDIGFLKVESEFFSSVGYNLLVLSGVLVAFEMGREVGIGGFDVRLVYLVLVEATVIVSVALLVSRALGFPLIEALIVAVALLSSSSITTYRLTTVIGFREVRRLALTITTLEDVALLTAISLVTGKPENPLVILTLSIIFALIAGAIFRVVFALLKGKEEYEIVIALTLTLGYASITQYFATPYLGAFVAGYLLGRTLGSRVSFDPYATLIILIYMVSISFVIPLKGTFRLDALVLLAPLILVAFIIRALSVFLATLLILRSGYYAAMLAGVLTTVSELAPLAVLTAYGGGLVGEDLAMALTMLPLLTIALSTLVHDKVKHLALVAGNYVTLELPKLPYEGIYIIGAKIMITSAKISAIMLGAVLLTILLNVINLSFLSLGVLVVAGLIALKFYRELWLEASMIGELPGLIARVLAVMIAGAVSAYVLHETLNAFNLKSLAWIAVISLYALIGFLLVELILNAKRYLEKAIVKLRPPL